MNTSTLKNKQKKIPDRFRSRQKYEQNHEYDNATNENDYDRN